MPFVTGFLRLRKRWGRPDIGLPGGEGGPPDWGLEGPEVEPPDPDEGDRPPFEKPLPTPPPGVWPGPTPANPIEPVPPEDPAEPGTIWPPVGGNKPGFPPVTKPQKVWILVYIPNHGVKYVCVDPSLIPPMPDLPERPPRPQPK